MRVRPATVIIATSALVARIALGQHNEDAPRAVELVIVGSTSEAVALVDTMRELLGRLGLVPNAHAVGRIEDAAKIVRGSAVARVEVDLSSEKETNIIVDTKDGPRRRTLRRDPSASIAREELAHAIQTVVEAQLFPDAEHHEGDANPLQPRPDVAPAPPAPVVITPDPPPPTQRDLLPPPPKSPWAIDVSVLAGGAGFSDNSGPVARLGASVSLVRRRGWSPSLGLDIHYVPPFDGSPLGGVPSPLLKGEQVVAAHASDLTFRLMTGVQLAHSSWLSINAAGGGGVDVLMVEPTSKTLGSSAYIAVAAPGTTYASPIISAALAADIAIISPVVFTLRVLGDFDVGDTTRYGDQTNHSKLLLSPWRVRPAVLFGFTFTLHGPAELAKK